MRAQPHNTKDPDAQYIKSVKVDAPSFDGHLDFQAYIDWQLAMDRYFHWCDMSESRKNSICHDEANWTSQTILREP